MTPETKRSPALDSALDEATAWWKYDLENLLHDAQSRFGDLVWKVLDDSEEHIGGSGVANALARKRSKPLPAIPGFMHDPNTNTPDRYREVWAHKAMIYFRASPAFHLRHLSRGIGTNTLSLNTRPSNKENVPPTPSQYSTPLRYTVFVEELLNIYPGKGGLGHIESFRIEHDLDGNEERRTDKLRQDLLEMWKTNFYSDTHLILSRQQITPNNSQYTQQEVTERSIFYAHAFILVSRSPYFASVLSRAKHVRRASPFVITLPSPPFTPTSLPLILEFIYTGRLPNSFFDTTDLSSVFDVSHGATFLGIQILPQIIDCHIINMLHGLCFAELEEDDYKELTQGSWYRMLSLGGCQCARCHEWLPRVFEFAMTSEMRDTKLEHGALRGVLKLFGLGWCTPQFAALSDKLKGYILLIFRFRVIIPGNVLSLLFAVEESNLEELIDPLPNTGLDLMKTMVLSVRDLLDCILCTETSKCLNSEEWETIMNHDVRHVELGLRSANNPRKLAIIGKAILRGLATERDAAVSAYQAINVYTKPPLAKSRRGVHTPTNSVLQAHLHHLKAEIRKIMDVVPEDLDDSPPSDYVRSSIQTLPSDPVTPIKARPTSIYSAYSILTPTSSSRASSSAETIDAARQSSSVGALDLGSNSSYSHASSRTESTNYGLFYTRRAYSDQDSDSASMVVSKRETTKLEGKYRVRDPDVNRRP